MDWQNFCEPKPDVSVLLYKQWILEWCVNSLGMRLFPTPDCMARNENIFSTVRTGQKPGNEVMVYTLQHVYFSTIPSYPVLINPAAVLRALSDRGRKRWDETSPAISHVDSHSRQTTVSIPIPKQTWEYQWSWEGLLYVTITKCKVNDKYGRQIYYAKDVFAAYTL